MINLEKDNALYENGVLSIIYSNYGKNNRNYGELFDFLSDYDIITASEIGDNVIVMSDIVFFFTEYDEIELSKRLSEGQKALYFFWYLDAQVTNGGFIQFYWNYYRRYLPPIIEGLKLIGDENLLELVVRADKKYLENKDKFDFQRIEDDWGPLYDKLKDFTTTIRPLKTPCLLALSIK